MTFGLKSTGHKIIIQKCQNSSGSQEADYKDMAKENLSKF